MAWTQKICAGNRTESGTSGALGISQDIMKGKDGEAEIRLRLWGHLGFFL